MNIRPSVCRKVHVISTINVPRRCLTDCKNEQPFWVRFEKKKTLHVNLETRHKYVDLSWLNLRLTVWITSDSPELLNSDQVSLNSPLTSLINFSGSRYWFEKQRLNRLLAHVRPDRIQIWAQEPQPVEIDFNIQRWDIQKNTLSSHI